MKKTYRKLFSLICSLCLLVSLFSGAAAEEAEAVQAEPVQVLKLEPGKALSQAAAAGEAVPAQFRAGEAGELVLTISAGEKCGVSLKINNENAALTAGEGNSFTHTRAAEAGARFEIAVTADRDVTLTLKAEIRAAADEPKDEPKDEPQEEPKDEPQEEPKDEPKAEPQDEPKADLQEEPKAEPQEEPKAEPQEEPKDEPEQPAADDAQPEETQEPTAEDTVPEQQIDLDAAEKEPESNPVTETEDKPDVQPEEKPAEQPEAVPAETEQATETEPEVKPEAGEEAVPAEKPEEDANPAEPEQPEEGNTPENVPDAEAEKPVPEAESFELPDDRQASFEILWDTEDPALGDTAHFVASLEGYDGLDYSVQWQYSKDDVTWEDIEGETGMTMDVVVTPENVENYWRLMVLIYVPDAEEAGPAAQDGQPAEEPAAATEPAEPEPAND